MSATNLRTTSKQELVHRQRRLVGPVAHSVAQRNGWSDAEIVFFVATASVATAAVVVLRAVDVVLDTWPELFGRRRGS
jgi:hypothetical protein